MSKKAKKKAVPKMTKKVEPTYYTTLTEEQFDDMKAIVLWDNPMSELEGITSSSEISLIEMSFKLGQIHKSFESMFHKLETILDSVAPEEENDEDEYSEEDGWIQNNDEDEENN
jgi:hypothetical protein